MHVLQPSAPRPEPVGGGAAINSNWHVSSGNVTMGGTTRSAQLAEWVTDARKHTLCLIEDLADEQLLGPQIGIVNPPLWEIGHVAWFQEKWVLRHVLGQPPSHMRADALYDSVAIAHDARWQLPFLSRAETLAYAVDVRDRVLQALERRHDQRLDYFVLLSVFHEDMHTEAFTYTRQTLALPPPLFLREVRPLHPAAGQDRCRADDVPISGGDFQLGAAREQGFVFDNEKWAHPVRLAPFRIARCAVTQSEFAAFVENQGYQRPELWSSAGWKWRETTAASHPVYWRRDEIESWRRRRFDQWLPLEPNLPVTHVNYYEAEAYCRWAGRRLPSEAEWELAAAGSPDEKGQLADAAKRRYPWGDQPPTPSRANLDWHWGGAVDVNQLEDGDSGFGCRQMIGNVWEWTASDFRPYPGFEPGPYRQYSQPWFGTHKVLRGASWATRSRLVRNTWRNFFTPDRRDVWAGFRTCAADS